MGREPEPALALPKVQGKIDLIPIVAIPTGYPNCLSTQSTSAV